MVKVIYEDNHLLVVEKPENMLSQGDSTTDLDMVNYLKKYLKDKYKKPGNVFVGLVHRLDRPVGGVMVFAKTSKAASRLSEQIRNRSFKKTYRAIIRGKLKKDKDNLMDYLYKDKKKNIVTVVDKEHKEAKFSELSFVRISTKNRLSLVEVNLMTGRSHQIRVQFANIDHPLYGDQKYGANINKFGQQLALWSYKLEFVHPTTKEKLFFTCEPPNKLPWNMFFKY